MVRFRRFIRFSLVMSAILVLIITALVLTYTEIGSSMEAEGVALSSLDLSAVPQSVVDDAISIATDLFGDYRGKYEEFVNQLLTAYVEARDKDCVVIFNSGGWGSSYVDKSPGWSTIISGIEAELEELGYSPLFLSYRRTTDNVRGRIEELVEIVRNYPSKAKNLAYRVDFLTRHVPSLKVIVAGESNGSVITDSVMNVLYNEPQVYSIQTGPPFWYKYAVDERKLILESNGTGPDAFSQGDIRSMVWESIKTLFGVVPSDRRGNILFFLKAPGHYYSWEYPEIYSEITNFLEKNFNSRSGNEGGT